MVGSWQTRNADYDRLHKIDRNSYQKLIESLDLQEENYVLDLMGGDGRVIRELWEYSTGKGLKLNLALSDRFPEQLQRASSTLYRRIIFRNFVEDARDLSGWMSNSLDRVVMKKGLHEIPRKDQQQVVNGVRRILKPGGIFALWDILSRSKTEQYLIQDIVRKKDELAGLDSFVRDRYFFTEEEAETYLETAGFTDIEIFERIPSHCETHRFVRTDFQGDESKLQEWNEYIRSRVSEEDKKKLKLKDRGSTIEMQFPEGIIRARKSTEVALKTP